MADTSDPRTPDAADEPERLDDLEPDAETETQVTGGSTVYIARAPGESRAQKTGSTRPAPSARFGAQGALARIEADRRAAASKGAAKAQIITECQWLAKKKDQLKRATEALEGEPLWLEVSVRQALAPDGTPAEFEVFKHQRSGADQPVDTLQGKIEGGKARVEWRYIHEDDDDDLSGSELVFRVSVLEDRARSTNLPIEGSYAFAVIDADGKPLAASSFVLKLPHGREVRGKTDADGRFETRGPVGKASVQLLGADGKSFLTFACVAQ